MAPIWNAIHQGFAPGVGIHSLDMHRARPLSRNQTVTTFLANSAKNAQYLQRLRKSAQPFPKHAPVNSPSESVALHRNRD